MKYAKRSIGACGHSILEWFSITWLFFIPLLGLSPVAPANQSSGLYFLDAEIDGLSGVDGLGGANSIAVSADGQHLYATGFFDKAVTAFSRDALGQLSFVETITNSDIGFGLQGANAVVVSPDDKHVYVASISDNAVIVFTRDASTGKLTLVEIKQDSGNGGNGLKGAGAIAISADNVRVYVVGTQDNALSVFDRNVNTGALTFLQMHQDDINGIEGLKGAAAVAISQDNLFLYLTSSTDNTVTVFTRNPALGEMAFVAQSKNGVDGVTGLGGASGIAVSPDNNQVYVASQVDSALVAFRRQPDGTLSYLQTYQDGVSGMNGLGGAKAVAVSPDGSNVYVASINDNAIAVFNRDAETGLLGFQQFLQHGQDVTTLKGATAVATSSDGTFVYTAALFSDAVTAFTTLSNDLQVTMTAVPEMVAIDNSITYTITVTNNGPDTATGVTLINTLPVGVKLGSVEPNSCRNEVNEITCVLGTLEPDQAAQITVNVTAPAVIGTGTLTNTATVTADQADTNAANNTASKTTQLVEFIPSVDLEVGITTEPEFVNVGSALTYTVTVTNNGPESATGITLTGTFSGEDVNYNASNSDSRCTHNDKTVTCQVTNLNANDTTEIPIQITTTTVGTITFTANVAGTEADPTSTNNQASVDKTVEALEFDLVLFNAVATPSTAVAVGTDITYTVIINNESETTVNGVTLSGGLAPQVSYVSSTAGCTNTQSVVTCPLGILKPNETRTVAITVRAIRTGSNISSTFSVTGNGTDTNLGNNLKLVQFAGVTGKVADFVVTVSDGGNTILVGTPLTYTVNVKNNGPDEASATLSIILSGTNVVIGTITGDGCGTGTLFSCALGTIEGGASKTVTIEATPTVVETLVLTAEVLGNAFDPTPNVARKETAISNKEANLSVGMIAQPAPAFLGNNFTYTATVTNHGPHEAIGVTLVNELSSSVEFVSAESTQGSPCTFANSKVTCLLGPINPADNPTDPDNPSDSNNTPKINMVVTPKTTGKVTSTVSVSSVRFDSDLSNNTVTVDTEISQLAADISLTISDTPDPVVVDNFLTYTLTLTNQGPNPATNIKLINTLPTDVRFQSPATISPAEVSGSCVDVNEENEVHCTIEALPNDGTVTVTLVVRPSLAGDFSFSAQVEANESDADETNNEAQVSTRVNIPSTLFFMEAQKNGNQGVQGLSGVIALTVSPDGQHVYAVGLLDNALVVFTRNSSDGHLKFAQVLIDGTNEVDGLAKATGVSISPDGNFVYTTSLNDSAVAVFIRDTILGTLNFVEVHKNGLNGVQGLGGALAITATASHVYVAGNSDDAIAIFSRRTGTGKLTFLESIHFEDESKSLNGVDALTVTPDGLHLLATSARSNRLSVFSIDTTNGSLNLMQTLNNNTDGVQGLDAASGVIVSPDGKHVYTSGGSDNAVSVFSRSLDAGTLTFVEVHKNGVDGIDGLTGAASLAISSDGNYVYVAGRNDNAVAAFRRDAETGKLHFVDFLKDGTDQIDGLAGASALAVSPSNVHLYVAGFSDDAVAVLSVAAAELSVVIKDSEDPINVNDNLGYTITVTNNGPQQATSLTLEDTLPANVRLLSFTPSQGECAATSKNDKINCTLGTLDNGAKLTVSLVVSPTDTGELTNKVTVSANQYDPTPDPVTETTQVVANADLQLDVEAIPDPATLEAALTYQVTITNNGPDAATSLTFSDEIPQKVKFESAEVSTDKTPCFFEEANRTVTCTITSLAAKTNKVVTIVVTPNTEGVTLSNVATVNAKTFDPDLDNNQVTTETAVIFNVIDDTYDNSGKELHNYVIGSTGAVIGGSLSGTIQNQGLLSEVWILPNTTVNGGKLSKNIVNEGTIENVQLLSGTVINGGVLRGNIVGFPEAPATLNTRIEADTQLAHVIIGIDSQVDSQVVIGEGVSFIANSTIPAGIELTDALPVISGPINGSRAVDLAKDVLVAEESLLDEINAIPDLKNNGLVFSQASDTGNLILPIGNTNSVLMPVKVSQVSADQDSTPSMTLHPDGSVTFVTATGRVILAQPSTQNQAELQTALANLGLDQLAAASDGNLTIIAGDHFKLRPDLYTQLANPLLPLGIEGKPLPLAKGLSEFVLRFTDSEEKRREQVFYPAAAHQQELRAVLLGFPGASDVTFYKNGKLSVTISGHIYSAVCDYVVKPGVANTVTQLLVIPDKNGDGSDDILVTYANGEQQILYIMPFPEVTADIQAIPEMQTAGYTVSQDVNGYYELTQGDTRLLMKATSLIALTEPTPPRMQIHPDGSVEFITATGVKIVTQPMMQDLAAFEAILQTLGLPPVVVEENGNLTVPVNETLSFSARPELQSTPASTAPWLGTQPGLYNLPTTLPGVLTLALVFKDEAGNTLQQRIYPAAKEPDTLYPFLAQMPGIKSVTFSNNGTISVQNSDLSFRGIFDYAVTAGEVPSGSIQFTQVPDVNGDGIADFAVIYGGGEKQLIYQIPNVDF